MLCAMRLQDCTYFLANRLTRTLKRAFDARLAGHGLTAATWCAMMALAENGPLGQKRLSAILALEHPTVTRTVDRLVEKGLVERRSDPGDRRQAIVALTDDGLALHAGLAEIGSCFMHWVTRNQGVDEVQQFKRLLVELHDQACAEMAGSGDG
ncbi:MAG: MarR family transcriptional regulator [Deltaproteobacteria bacterium]|nr:MarR family transcriptional regulator [Candidatus Anaeroferrophillacea bacterium]